MLRLMRQGAPRLMRPRRALSGTASDATLSWEALGLTEEVGVGRACRDGAGLGLEKPCDIQERGVPLILRGEHVSLSARTGSGKTLAYLAPLVHMLKAEEMNAQGAQRELLLQRPRGMVLAPTWELCDQILRVVKALGHRVRIASCALTAKTRLGHERKHLRRIPVDLVVGTPGRVLKHLRTGSLFTSQLRYLVIDEVDTMFEEGFQEDVVQILHSAQRFSAVSSGTQPGSGHDKVQLITAGAAWRAQTKRVLESCGVHECHDVRGVRLHQGVESVRHRFVDVRGADKIELLLSVLKEDSKGKFRGRRRVGNTGVASRSGSADSARIADEEAGEDGVVPTLIFCNTASSCAAVEYAVKDAGFRSAHYTGDLPTAIRRERWASFVAGDLDVLVATDIAALGLDAPHIGHVVIFDFPRDAITYLHRAGRTGRLGGRQGRITSLVARRDQALARHIEDALEHGRPVTQFDGGAASVLRAARETALSSNASDDLTVFGHATAQESVDMLRGKAGTLAHLPRRTKDRLRKRYHVVQRRRR